MNPPDTILQPAEPLILASASPRRRSILSEAGYRFDVVVPPLEEPDHVTPGLSPADQAEALAYFKARAVADATTEAIVLGADTIVAVGQEVLGKPDGQADARRMLEALSATRHAVITGVALLGPGPRRRILSDTTYVTMRPLSAEDVQGYIDSQEWVDKAGAYAIQETADRFVDRIEGSFTNIVGLPIELVRALLAELLTGPGGQETSP
jgi:septum formation protein